MKTTATVITIAGLGLVLAVLSLVRAQGHEWQDLTKEVTELYHAGEYERAVPIAKKALDVAITDDGARVFVTHESIFKLSSGS